MISINSIINDYHALHQIPEIGHTLPQTKEYIINQLKKTTASIYEIEESSLIAIFDFGCSDYIAFRTEMDGLLITEKERHKIRSKYHNTMHACGHDTHMAILLQLAYYLTTCNTLKHNIILIFEEAEETDGNTINILNFLNTNNYTISAFFCMHMWPNLPYGKLYSNPHILMAESHELTVEIAGSSSHISNNSYEQDALLAGCEFVDEVYKHLQYIMLNNTRYRFGSFQSGTICNAVSEKTIIKGSCRTLDSKELNKLQKHIIYLSENIDMKYHTSTHISYSKGYSAVKNSPRIFKKISTHIPIESIEPLFTCESAGEYLKHYKGCYLLLGMGETSPLHSSDFHVDEALLSIGFDYYLSLLNL